MKATAPITSNATNLDANDANGCNGALGSPPDASLADAFMSAVHEFSQIVAGGTLYVVEGEAFAIPVTGGAQSTNLIRDHAQLSLSIENPISCSSNQCLMPK